MTSSGSSNQATPGAAPAAQQTATGVASPGTFQLDQSASAVSFRHKHTFGLAWMTGTFSGVTGSAEILADGSARGRLEIPAATISTKIAQRDTHLKSADFFHAELHPAIVADITSATLEGSDRVAATGTLTVAGKTRPLALTAQLTEATAQAITLATTIEVDRADFGLTWNRLGIIKGHAHVSVVARFVRQAPLVRQAPVRQAQ
jgi:polyisoprenoid-binding protein YceI